jgi:hypothetical protein
MRKASGITSEQRELGEKDLQEKALPLTRELSQLLRRYEADPNFWIMRI